MITTLVAAQAELAVAQAQLTLYQGILSDLMAYHQGGGQQYTGQAQNMCQNDIGEARERVAALTLMIAVINGTK